MYRASSLIETAMRIATSAHEGQVRKTDGSPYIVHPTMCALILTEHGFGETIIAGALVHDVVEDSHWTHEALTSELGSMVGSIVRSVTEDKTLPWEERKKRYVEAVRTAPESAKAVSIADKIHNAESLLCAHAEKGDAVWSFFNKGKAEKLWFEELCLAMFKETWDHPLVAEYEGLVEQLRKLD